MLIRHHLAAISAAAFFIASPALAGPDFVPGRKVQYPSPNLNAPDADKLTLHGPDSTGEIPKMTVGGVPLGALIGRQNGKVTLTPDAVQIQGTGSTGDVSGTSVKPNGLSVSRFLAERAGDALTVMDAGAKTDGTVTSAATVQGFFDFIAGRGAGGTARFPSGRYNFDSVPALPAKVGLDLDAHTCFEGNRAPPIVQEVGQEQSCYSVKTFAGYATENFSTVLNVFQVQPTIPTSKDANGNDIIGLNGQQSAVLIRQRGTNTNPNTSGLVGFEVQQSLAPGPDGRGGIKHGILWPLHALVRIYPEQSPNVALAEIEVHNDSGIEQPKAGDPLYGAVTALHSDNLGNTVSFAAHAPGGSGGWRYATICSQPAVRHWCDATVDANQDVLAGTAMSGANHAQSYGIGKAIEPNRGDADMRSNRSGIKNFAYSDGAGGVVLEASKLVLGGTQVETAWTGYTPSVSAESGSVVPVGGGGAYKVVGKTVSFRVAMTISGKGNASGALYLDLPVPAKELTSLSAMEQVNFVGLASYVQPGRSNAIIKTTNNAFPLTGATGPWLVIVSGTYEAQ